MYFFFHLSCLFCILLLKFDSNSWPNLLPFTINLTSPIRTNSNCCAAHLFQIRYCTTPQQRFGLIRTSPRAFTASPPLMPGSQSTTSPPVWRLPLLAPMLWQQGRRGTTGRQQLTTCHSSSNSSSSSTSNSKPNYNSCSRSNKSSTTSNNSSCSISNNRWLTRQGLLSTPSRVGICVCVCVFISAGKLWGCNCEDVRTGLAPLRH